MLGAYRVSAALAAIAALGFIVATAYSLRMMQRVFFGENSHGWRIPDLSAREMTIVILTVLPLLWLGSTLNLLSTLSAAPLPGARGRLSPYAGPNSSAPEPRFVSGIGDGNDLSPPASAPARHHRRHDRFRRDWRLSSKKPQVHVYLTLLGIVAAFAALAGFGHRAPGLWAAFRR